MNEEERLWAAKVDVLVKATTKEEAEEKIKDGFVLINDVLEVEPEDLVHLVEGESRERMRQKIFGALKRREKYPSASW